MNNLSDTANVPLSVGLEQGKRGPFAGGVDNRYLVSH